MHWAVPLQPTGLLTVLKMWHVHLSEELML